MHSSKFVQPTIATAKKIRAVCRNFSPWNKHSTGEKDFTPQQVASCLILRYWCLQNNANLSYRKLARLLETSYGLKKIFKFAEKTPTYTTLCRHKDNQEIRRLAFEELQKQFPHVDFSREKSPWPHYVSIIQTGSPYFPDGRVPLQKTKR